MNELIVVKQLPIIEERLRSMSEEIEKATAQATGLVCTEDTVKEVKSIRADLSKQFGALEVQRKEVKKSVLAPYEAFEAVYRECVSDKFKAADAALKDKIDEVEAALLGEKDEQIKKFYNELAAAYGIDFIPYEKLKINVTKTASLKSFKDYVEKYFSAVMDDMAIISKQMRRDEILAEYKQSLNLRAAISHVDDIHKSIEAEARKRAERAPEVERQESAVEKVDALAAPAVIETAAMETVEDDPVLRLTFAVTAPKSKLRLLKQFLIDGGYDYE